MAVDAIGGNVGSGAGGQITPQGLSINDFLHLFLSQLQFQDPLKPVDNTQFLAQLAQFTNIEQTQVMSDNISGLLSMQASNQALSMLNRTVNFSYNNQATVGTVNQISFANGQPSLTITPSGSSSPVTGVSLSQITLVSG